MYDLLVKEPSGSSNRLRHPGFDEEITGFKPDKESRFGFSGGKLDTVIEEKTIPTQQPGFNPYRRGFNLEPIIHRVPEIIHKTSVVEPKAPVTIQKSRITSSVPEVLKIKSPRKAMSRQKNSWTEAEDALLRLHYPKGGISKALELLPNKSKTAIRLRVRNLGITLSASISQRAPWTEEEKAAIRAIYPTGTRQELEEKLPGRSWTSILIQASKLGVKTASLELWTPEEDEIIRENAKDGLEKCVSLLPRRTASATRMHALKMGINLRKSRRVNKEKVNKLRPVWTKENQRILMNLYPTGGTAAVMEALPGFYKKEILQKASTLMPELFKKQALSRTGKESYKLTPELEKRLREAYENKVGMKGGKGATLDIAEEFNIPSWRVSRFAKELGLSGAKGANWKEEEIALLKEYACESIPDIVRRFRKAGFTRNENAIKIKLQRFGFDRTDPNSFTCNRLSKLFGIDSHVISNWIKLELLKASRAGTERKELQGGDHYKIKKNDLRKFVKENPERIDLRKITEPIWFINLMTGKSEPILHETTKK